MRHGMRVGVWFLCVGAGVAAAGWALFSPAGRPPSAPPALPSPILVDDFETGTTQGLSEERKNRLDAFQGTFAQRPSYVVITKCPDTRPRPGAGADVGGGKGTALRMEYGAGGGWCGWYTLLNGIDVSRHNCLTFWVKGERGGERFDIGLSDERMQRMEIDAVYAGSIKSFLPQGVTPEWQQVKIPLAGMGSDLELSRMGALVFRFRYEGKGAIQIDDVAFVYDPQVERLREENIPRAKPDPRAPRASWVWKYDPLSNLQVRRELFSFCERTALTTLYIYLGEDPISRTPPDYQQKLAQFLAEAHRRGIQVHALQGNPRWALKQNHHLAFQWVKGYLDFNQGHPAAERIDGVSLDIEPYLTSEWESGNRDSLKAEFLDLLASLRKLIDKETETLKGSDPKGSDPRSLFTMGVAIPVFYEREPQFEEGLLSQVDVAALMDYFDSAEDIVAHSRFHLNLARRLGKKVVVAVETQDLVQMGQGKRRNTFHEEGWLEMEQELAKVAQALASNPAFAGLAIHAYDSYRLLQKGRNVPTRERTGKVPPLSATRAEPSAPVVVDGDLQDWAGASRTQVDQRSQVAYGPGAWAGPHDAGFKAAFRWEPEALLVAIDVTDNLLVQESTGADMWEGDHAELWVDADLAGDYNEAVNSSDDFQFGLSPGNFKEIKPEVHLWVPSAAPGSLAGIQIAAQKKPFGYTLELRLPAKAVGHSAFQAGFKMGIMADLSDTDDARQPQKCMLSSSPERQWGDPTTFNVLELQ